MLDLMPLFDFTFVLVCICAYLGDILILILPWGSTNVDIESPCKMEEKILYVKTPPEIHTKMGKRRRNRNQSHFYTFMKSELKIQADVDWQLGAGPNISVNIDSVWGMTYLFG